MIEAEQSYIERAKEGDNTAFGALYDSYAPAIYRFLAVKVSTRQEAEDLTHEVFLSAWQKLPGFKEQGFPFSSWLYKIARNRVIDYYRTKKSPISIDDEDSGFEDLSDDAPKAGDAVDLILDIASVKKALCELSPDQREVIELRYMAELSPIEIAQILGKREGTIRIIQFRALNKLKELIEGPDASQNPLLNETKLRTDI
jgi:RNA polymerase sigma-70 factor (ECF subfamily)